jgi:hypothetical protein
MDVTAFLNFMGKRLESGESEDSDGPKRRKLTQMFRKCEFETTSEMISLWGLLCSDIHGYSWNGDSILIYSKGLEEKHICLLKELSVGIGLDVNEA